MIAVGPNAVLPDPSTWPSLTPLGEKLFTLFDHVVATLVGASAVCRYVRPSTSGQKEEQLTFIQNSVPLDVHVGNGNSSATWKRHWFHRTRMDTLGAEISYP